MTIWTSSGPVHGAISRKAIHLLTEDERKQVVKLKDMWIDIGKKPLVRKLVPELSKWQKANTAQLAADTKAEVLWRKVEKSDAEKFLEVGARVQVGNVVLSMPPL